MYDKKIVKVNDIEGVYAEVILIPCMVCQTAFFINPRDLNALKTCAFCGAKLKE